MRYELLDSARNMVMLEGLLLDQRDWKAWLALYAADARYWIPCWIDEHNLTSDPQTQMSLIYYRSRSGLEDRVFRLNTNTSLASSPLPRTCHMTSITRTQERSDGTILVDSNWTVHSYRLEKAHYFFGSQTHILRLDGGELKIAERKIIVANDIIPNVLDIYSV